MREAKQKKTFQKKKPKKTVLKRRSQPKIGYVSYVGVLSYTEKLMKKHWFFNKNTYKRVEGEKPPPKRRQDDSPKSLT